MLKEEGTNSLTPDIKFVRLTMSQLIELYDLGLGKTDLTGDSGEFLHFYDNWGKSIVYKIPSGYVRFRHIPGTSVTLIHGLFTGNPFRDSENLKKLLNFYLEKHKEVSHVECHVNKKFRGVVKLVSRIATSSALRDENWIFSYGGI